MSPTRRGFLFRICALIAFGAAGFHAAAMVSPAFARMGYAASYPMWRHLVFIIVNGGVGWFLLRRPPWLVWVIAAYTAQILNGHGRGALREWMEHRHIAWLSLAVSLVALTTLLLLVIDRQARRIPTKPVPGEHRRG